MFQWILRLQNTPAKASHRLYAAWLNQNTGFPLKIKKKTKDDILPITLHKLEGTGGLIPLLFYQHCSNRPEVRGYLTGNT